MISKVKISGAGDNNILRNGENNFVVFSQFPNMVLLSYAMYIVFLLCILMCMCILLKT